MILLYINLAIFVICMVLFMLMCLSIKHKFIEMYPDRKIAKIHWSTELLNLLRVVICALIPLFNICLLFIMIFKSEELTEQTLWKLFKTSVAKESET